MVAGSERKYRRVLPPVFLNVRPDGVLVPRLEKWDLTSRTVCRSSDQEGGVDTSMRDITSNYIATIFDTIQFTAL